MWIDKHETFDVQDGHDTIEWAAKLPQSDGRVGTWGHSNASWAIWVMLHSQPPSLAAGTRFGHFDEHVGHHVWGVGDGSPT